MTLDQLALLKTFAELPDVRSRFTGSALETRVYDRLLLDIDADVRNMQLNRLPFNLVDIQPDEGGINQPIDSAQIDAPADIDLENYVTLAQWIPTWLDCARECATFVNEDFAHDRDANAHLWRRPVVDPSIAVILGSGASLNDTVVHLKDFPGYIIAGPSNAAIACAHGAPPHAILGIDSGFGTVNYLRSGPFAALGSDLITNPLMHPDVISLFPSAQRRWFLSMIQMGKGAQHNFNLFMKLLFKPIISWMYQAGCTVNAEIGFLHMLEVMGHPRFRAVYLLGVDFCYREHASRCASYRFDENSNSWDKRDVQSPSTSIQTNSKICRARNGLITDEGMVAYKRSLLTMWAISEIRLFNCSPGIITEIPTADFASLEREAQCSTDKRWSDPKEGEFYAEGTRIQDTYKQYLTETGYVEGKSSGFEGTPVSGELWGRDLP